MSSYKYCTFLLDSTLSGSSLSRVEKRPYCNSDLIDSLKYHYSIQSNPNTTLHYTIIPQPLVLNIYTQKQYLVIVKEGHFLSGLDVDSQHTTSFPMRRQQQRE